jgi:hypothetical protein
MPERPDLRKIASDIREALVSYPQDALVDILTYVFQAYVVEGAPAVHAPQPERVQELEGLSFAELMQTLQLRLDLPELSLFEVSNGRVSIRLGGELHPVAMGSDARRAVAAPLPAGQAPAPAPQPAAAAPRSPGSTVTEAPRPTRGLSVNPTPGQPGAPRPAAPQQAAPQGGPRPGSSSTAPGDEPGDDDAASKRFKLLEID